MAKQQSSSLVTIALLAIGGYFLYENWATISADLTLSPAAATTSATTYPNSPVPISTPIGSDFVDSAGNEWQYNTQTGVWVIVVPAASAGTIVTATTPAPATVVPATAGTVVATAATAAVPATAGTVVSTASGSDMMPETESIAIPMQAPANPAAAPQITRVILPGSFWRAPWGPVRPAQPLIQANGAPQVAPLTVQ